MVQVPLRGLRRAAWNHSSAVIRNFILGLEDENGNGNGHGSDGDSGDGNGNGNGESGPEGGEGRPA